MPEQNLGICRRIRAGRGRPGPCTQGSQHPQCSRDQCQCPEHHQVCLKLTTLPEDPEEKTAAAVKSSCARQFIGPFSSCSDIISLNSNWLSLLQQEH